MELYIETIVRVITEYMYDIGPIIGILIVIFESIIPVLPLGIFITLNTYAYGLFWGFVISWIGTLIGCMISFMVFRKWFRGYLWGKIEHKDNLIRFMNYLTDIEYNKLVLLIAMPFSPAFLINIGAGLSKISIKKFFFAILIGKISIVYFWGYIGTGLIESIREPLVLFEISIVLIIAYIISKILGRNLNIE